MRDGNGTNFGTGCGANNLACPGADVSICQTGSPDPCTAPSDPALAIGHSITFWSNTQINAQLTVGINASGFYDAQIISAGGTGNGFLAGQSGGDNGTGNRSAFESSPRAPM